MTANPMKGDRSKFDDAGKKNTKLEDSGGMSGRLFGGGDRMGGEKTIGEEVDVGRRWGGV